MAVLTVGALILSQCSGDEEEAGSGDQETPGATEVSETPAITVTSTPPAPEPLPAEPAPPSTVAPAPQPSASPPPAAPEFSGPPPEAVGVIPGIALSLDGFAHALFVEEYFSGPVTGYSANSSDNEVARAGVSAADMLIVTPVSEGSADIIVTATGPGGAVTQTFVATVGGGAPQADRPTVAPAAPTGPPAAQPIDNDDVSVQEEEPELPPAPTTTTEQATATATAEATATTTDQVTTPPTLAGPIPPQTVAVAQTLTVDISPFFGGVVQGWSVTSSQPTHVEVSMTVAGEVNLRGLSTGSATITVTAVNSQGSVAQAFIATAN